MRKELEINQLNVILKKALKAKDVMIDSILAGDQHDPKTLKIGYGGILTLTLEIDKRKNITRAQEENKEMKKDRKDQLALDGVVAYGDRLVRKGGRIKFAGIWCQDDRLLPYVDQYVGVRADGYWIIHPEIWLPTYPEGKYMFDCIN